MNLLILTHQYDLGNKMPEATPVVNHFVEGFINSGHDCRVAYIRNQYPLLHLLHEKIKAWLEGRYDKRIVKIEQACSLGFNGEKIFVRPVNRLFSRRLSNFRISTLVRETIDWCNSSIWRPDMVLVHWEVPYVSIGRGIADFYKIPSALVIHSLDRVYSKLFISEITQYDYIGFRSEALYKKYSSSVESGLRNDLMKKGFICSSGVDIPSSIMITDSVKTFLFVGSLIRRKYPVAVAKALNSSDIEYDKLVYCGKGALMEDIKEKSIASKTEITGHVSKEIVFDKMFESDCLIMISQNEAFGLVYLEAMIRGLIVIASRNESMDGIIEHGKNGFLCEAGSTKELTLLLNHINSLPKETVLRIRENARATALNYTKARMANKYLANVNIS